MQLLKGNEALRYGAFCSVFCAFRYINASVQLHMEAASFTKIGRAAVKYSQRLGKKS